MTKKQSLLVLALLASLSLYGCGGEKDAKKSSDTEESVTELAGDELSEELYEESFDEFDDTMLEFETETEEILDPIVPSDYLVTDISDYIEPGELKGLSATQFIYEVTDESVQEQIQFELEMYAQETEVDRESQSGDTVYVVLSSSVNETPVTENEETYFLIGSEEFGPEFDQELTGVSAGDELSFSIEFGEDAWVEEWINETVDFELSVTSVCENTVPEYNEEFVTSYTGYASTEEYEAAVRETLENDYNDLSLADTEDSLFLTAMEQSVFSSYPQDLYDSTKEEIYDFYLAFTGSNDMDEVYELFSTTEEEIEAEILETINRRLLISAVCAENDIEVTDDEYFEYVRNTAFEYGYESASQYEQDFGRAATVWTLYEEKVGSYLYENADITKENYSEDMVIDTTAVGDESLLEE